MMRFLALILSVLAFAVEAKPLTVYFVRHGQTQWNLERRFQGSTSFTDINEKGVHQAEETRDGLRKAGLRFNRIYTSPYLRAKHTAEIIAGAFGQEPRIDERIREMCFGHYEGTFYKDGKYVDENFGFAFNDPEKYVAPPEAETYRAFIDRVGGFLEDELKPLEGTCDSVLVVAHSGVLRAMLVYLKDIPFADFWRVPQPNCCANVIVCENGRFRVAERGRSFTTETDPASSSLTKEHH